MEENNLENFYMTCFGVGQIKSFQDMGCPQFSQND